MKKFIQFFIISLQFKSWPSFGETLRKKRSEIGKLRRKTKANYLHICTSFQSVSQKKYKDSSIAGMLMIEFSIFLDSRRKLCFTMDMIVILIMLILMTS